MRLLTQQKSAIEVRQSIGFPLFCLHWVIKPERSCVTLAELLNLRDHLVEPFGVLSAEVVRFADVFLDVEELPLAILAADLPLILSCTNVGRV